MPPSGKGKPDDAAASQRARPEQAGSSGRMTRTHAQQPAGRTTSMVPGRSVSAGGSGQSPAQSGAGRMVFRPVMPPRRRPSGTPGASTPLSSAPATPSPPAGTPPPPASRPRGPPRPPPQMTASGPFALGPNDQRAARTNTRAAAAGRAPLTAAQAPGLTTSVSERSSATPAASAGSDEEDVTVVDIQRVHELDDRAPQALRTSDVQAKAEPRALKEEGARTASPDVNAAQALDLSDTEEEEGEDELAGRFVSCIQEGDSEGRLFLFQFPQSLPSWGAADASSLEMKDEVEVVEDPSTSSVQAGNAPPRPEGEVGRLNIYADGRVALQLGGAPFDITGGCEVDFLQQVMVLDAAEQKAECLGELDAKLVATPDLEYLLGRQHVSEVQE